MKTCSLTSQVLLLTSLALVQGLPPTDSLLQRSSIQKRAAPPPPIGGVNPINPVYHVTSDFDFQSLSLALYQEYIELDLFHFGLKKFSVQNFTDAGLNADDRFLIEFMAEQEVGHALALSNLLGLDRAAKQCNYTYPFETVAEFVDFCQKLTRVGESGVYGFLPHLDSRPSAQILLQSISTEARQQMIFRQFEGLFPMPVFFETGIPQAWAWTLLAPFITSCPANNTRLEWPNFPALNILNNPNGTVVHNANGRTSKATPGITHNQSVPLSFPGRTIRLEWDTPGKSVGPNGSYVTVTNATEPKFVVWVSQYNATYTPLFNVSSNTGFTTQPNGTVYPNIPDPIVNGTMFIAITDSNPFVTPHNLSLINTHVVAGPALYQSG